MNKQINNHEEHSVWQECNVAGSSTKTKVIAGAGTAVGASLATYVSHKTGLFDMQLVPEVPAYSQIVDGFVVANESLRATAPIIALGAIATRAYQIFSKNGNSASESLAKSDWSGVNQEKSSENRSTLFESMRTKVGEYKSGIAVTALVVLLTGGSSGVENEVSFGPLRPVDQMFDQLVESPAASQFIITQNESTTFMDDSYIGADDLVRLSGQLATQGVDVIPFKKTLPNINNRNGIVLSLPAAIFENYAPIDTSTDCKDVPIVVDDAGGSNIGDAVDINGLDATVVGTVNGATQMNRDVAIMTIKDHEKCVEGAIDTPMFGAIVAGAISQPELQRIVDESSIEGSVLTRQEFNNNNLRFWRANGTPILLQLIAYVGALGGFAIANERRNNLQKNIKEIGLLNAAGVPLKKIRNIELKKALIETNKATLLAVPLMPVMAGLFNAAIFGLKIGVGLREVAVGYSVALTAKTVGSLRAMNTFKKRMKLSEAIKS